MNISRNELKEFTIQVARREFGTNIFKRRQLMQEVEKFVKNLGYWSPEDDKESRSVGRKSKGLANIDWTISSLKQEGRLLNIRRDQWCLQ